MKNRLMKNTGKTQTLTEWRWAQTTDGIKEWLTMFGHWQHEQYTPQAMTVNDQQLWIIFANYNFKQISAQLKTNTKDIYTDVLANNYQWIQFWGLVDYSHIITLSIDSGPSLVT